jgi:uncharacterized protein
MGRWVIDKMLAITIPPREGAALELKKGQLLKVIDLEGGQVADLLAYRASDFSEKLSTGATIDNNGSLYIGQGDYLYSNRHNSLMQIVEDKVGAHDLLHPPCSPAMYRAQYNIQSEHPSCMANFIKVLSGYGLAENDIVTPFNIFMNTRVTADGRVEVKAPLSRAGDYLILRAETDLLVAVTACSVEESACNANYCTAIRLEVYSQGAPIGN